MPAYKGFTLIESIVAIALLGVILIASAALSRGIPLMQDARDQSIALTIARNKLDALRTLGYDALPSSGSFTDTSLSSIASSSASVTVTTFNAKTRQASVAVAWRARDNTQHSVALTTLITQVGGL